MGRRGAPQDLRRLTSACGPHEVEVRIRLFANLADYGPVGASPARVALPVGATVGDLLRRLRIPEELPRLLLVNGQAADATTELGSGDVVDVLPPLVGG